LEKIKEKAVSITRGQLIRKPLRGTDKLYNGNSTAFGCGQDSKPKHACEAPKGALGYVIGRKDKRQ